MTELLVSIAAQVLVAALVTTLIRRALGTAKSQRGQACQPLPDQPWRPSTRVGVAATAGAIQPGSAPTGVPCLSCANNRCMALLGAIVITRPSPSITKLIVRVGGGRALLRRRTLDRLQSSNVGTGRRHGTKPRGAWDNGWTPKLIR